MNNAELKITNPDVAGTGSALKMRLFPGAYTDHNIKGYIKLTIAPQTKGTNLFNATFGWQAQESIDLNFADISKLLMVMDMNTDCHSINSGCGIEKKMPEDVVLQFRAQRDRTAEGCLTGGVSLTLLWKSKHRPTPSAIQSIRLTASQTYGLYQAIKGAMTLIAFGYPYGIGAFE